MAKANQLLSLTLGLALSYGVNWKVCAMLHKGMKLLHNGQVKTLSKYEAEWSLALASIPHRLFILWEGESKYQRFESDNKGNFVELDTAD